MDVLKPGHTMDLLPDTSYCGLRMRRDMPGTVSPPPTSKETAS